MVMDGPYILTTVINGVSQQKVESSWTDDDNKKVLYDKKEKNIIVSALGINKFSECIIAKQPRKYGKNIKTNT